MVKLLRNHFKKLLVGLALIPFVMYGQQNYYVTDSVRIEGVHLIDGGGVLNFQYCIILVNGNIVKLPPEKVKEYGYKNGRVFISKDVNLLLETKRVFLERISSGKINLYFYKYKSKYNNKYIRILYLEKGDTFIDLTKYANNVKDLHNLLKAWTSDCSEVADAIKNVHNNRKSLKLFIDQYNRCELKYFPRFRLGVIAGYELSKLTIPANDIVELSYLNPVYAGSITGGFLMDLPVVADEMSLHSEFVFSKSVYSYNGTKANVETDLLASYYLVKFPLLMRYGHSFNRFHPFVDVGFEGTVVLKTEEVSLYKLNPELGYKEIVYTDLSPMLSSLQMGYAMGAGFEYRLSNKLSFLIEMRYTKQYGLSSSDSFNTNYFEFSTGIIF